MFGKLNWIEKFQKEVLICKIVLLVNYPLVCCKQRHCVYARAWGEEIRLSWRLERFASYVWALWSSSDDIMVLPLSLSSFAHAVSYGHRFLIGCYALPAVWTHTVFDEHLSVQQVLPVCPSSKEMRRRGGGGLNHLLTCSNNPRFIWPSQIRLIISNCPFTWEEWKFLHLCSNTSIGENALHWGLMFRYFYNYYYRLIFKIVHHIDVAE